MKFVKVLTAFAAIGMVAIPVSASANTRPEKSSSSYFNNNGNGKGHVNLSNGAYPKGLLNAINKGAKGKGLERAMRNNAHKSRGC